MAWSPNVWNQLKSITAGDLASALKRDGWQKDTKGGSAYIYLKLSPIKGEPPRRVSIHFHPQKTYGAGMLQGLLADIGWDDDDLRRLKLIK